LVEAFKNKKGVTARNPIFLPQNLIDPKSALKKITLLEKWFLKTNTIMAVVRGTSSDVSGTSIKGEEGRKVNLTQINQRVWPSNEFIFYIPALSTSEMYT